MTVSQKVLFSFLLSALLCAGIAVFAITGVISVYAAIAGEVARILIFAAIFLTLFFIIFFCFNLRRGSVDDFRSAEAVHDEVVYEQNGIHYIKNDVLNNDKKSDELDSNFANLIESVVKNKEFE